MVFCLLASAAFDLVDWVADISEYGAGLVRRYASSRCKRSLRADGVKDKPERRIVSDGITVFLRGRAGGGPLEGGVNASSLMGLVGLSVTFTGVDGLKGVGGAGRVFPSIDRVFEAGEETDAALIFSLMRSATVPDRRRAALCGSGDAV